MKLLIILSVLMGISSGAQAATLTNSQKEDYAKACVAEINPKGKNNLETFLMQKTYIGDEWTLKPGFSYWATIDQIDEYGADITTTIRQTKTRPVNGGWGVGNIEEDLITRCLFKGQVKGKVGRPTYMLTTMSHDDRAANSSSCLILHTSSKKFKPSIDFYEDEQEICNSYVNEFKPNNYKVN